MKNRLFAVADGAKTIGAAALAIVALMASPSGPAKAGGIWEICEIKVTISCGLEVN